MLETLIMFMALPQLVVGSYDEINENCWYSIDTLTLFSCWRKSNAAIKSNITRTFLTHQINRSTFYIVKMAALTHFLTNKTEFSNRYLHFLPSSLP